MTSFYGFISPEAVSFLSGLAGAMIGGFFTLGAVWQAFRYSRKLQEDSQLNTARGAVLAIRTELEMLSAGYFQEIGSKIEKLEPNQPLLITYRLTQNYFSVYEANCGLIGLIEDNELRSAIVGVYAAAKGLVDTHLLNNDLIDKLNKAPDAGASMLARFQLNAFALEMKAAYQLTRKRLERVFQAMDRSKMLKASSVKQLRA